MANNRLIWEGLEELKAALRQLPSELASEGADIVDDTTNEVEAAYIAGLPDGPTGNLRKGVSVKRSRSTFGVENIVQSRAPHSHLWNYGSAVRHTSLGFNRGAMPPAPPEKRLGSIAARKRRDMYRKLGRLLERKGLEVSGA